jgi:hypothetical protein
MMLICADSTELVYSIPKFVFICRCGRRKASELSILEEKWFYCRILDNFKTHPTF